MKKLVARTCLAVLPLLLLAGNLASAEVEQVGNVRVSVDGKLSPRALPRKGTAPVSVEVGGQVSTTDGTTPPQLRELKIEINRHGHFDFTGLPSCKLAEIQPASDSRALANCRSALVGEGSFKGTITLPGSEPFPIEGRLLLFNGSEGSHRTLFGHVYTPEPFGTSFVIRFKVTAEKGGRFGTVLTADLGQALGEKRSLSEIEMKLSRRFTYRGRRRSFLSAGCPAPKGFRLATYALARTTFAFADGRKLTTVLNRSCQARG